MMMMKFVSMKASNLIPEGSFEVWWQRYCPLRTKRVQFQLPNRHGVGPRLRNLSDLCNVLLHRSRREGRFAICKLAVSAALDSGATPFRFARHSRRCSNYTHPKSPCWWRLESARTMPPFNCQVSFRKQCSLIRMKRSVKIPQLGLEVSQLFDFVLASTQSNPRCSILSCRNLSILTSSSFKLPFRGLVRSPVRTYEIRSLAAVVFSIHDETW
jgi:hypothetical protein